MKKNRIDPLSILFVCILCQLILANDAMSQEMRIGDAYGGGIIYQLQGNKAYVVTSKDVAQSIKWRDAAASCANDTSGNLPPGSWFLPTEEQWASIGNTNTLLALNTNTNFTPFAPHTTYWSASCYYSDCNGSYAMAYAQDFRSAILSDWHILRVGYELSIRCVRETT